MQTFPRICYCIHIYEVHNNGYKEKNPNLNEDSRSASLSLRRRSRYTTCAHVFI